MNPEFGDIFHLWTEKKLSRAGTELQKSHIVTAIVNISTVLKFHRPQYNSKNKLNKPNYFYLSYENFIKTIDLMKSHNMLGKLKL